MSKNPTSRLLDILDEKGLWDGMISLKRNDLLSTEGSCDTNLYYILSGSLRAYTLDGAVENTIRLAYSEDFITAMDSFMSGSKSNLYIECIKKSELKYISKSNFTTLIYSSPLWTKYWINSLELLVFQQLQREQDILISSPKARLQRVLARSPRLFQEIPHKYIASYLRMTPETLSRIKNLD